MADLLRDVQRADLAIIRGWRNHPDINRFMFTQHEVTTSEHLSWFESSISNKLRSLFVYEIDGSIQGFLQLEKKSKESGVYDWGFYINPDAKRGLGTKMARLAFDKLFIEMGAVKLFAEVLSFNEPSIRFHNKLGFKQEGILRRQHFLKGQYHDVYCFGLVKSDGLNKATEQ